VGFENLDFGKLGSAEFTMPVFALDSDAHPFKVYDGIPSRGGKLIGEFVYQKPSIWNVYQEDTWNLEEPLIGMHTLCFEFDDKIHVKGFSFAKPDKAFMYLNGADADEMYGDDFTVNGTSVEGIGNNVTINFTGMDFGEKGTGRVLIKGRAPKGTNTIHVRFFDENGESRNVIEFAQCEEVTEREFEIEKTTGMKNVSFVFMPGSCFDLAGFKFL
jgi:beta-galactosidase